MGDSGKIVFNPIPGEKPYEHLLWNQDVTLPHTSALVARDIYVLASSTQHAASSQTKKCDLPESSNHALALPRLLQLLLSLLCPDAAAAIANTTTAAAAAAAAVATDPNFEGVSQQVTVDGTTITYRQVLNTNTSAVFTNGSAADGTFLVPGSSFTSSFSVDGSHISVIGGKGSDLFLTNVLNGTGNDSFFQVYNPSNPGFPGIGGQPGFPGNPGGTNGLDGVLLFRLDR
jgi:hypothetical protein